MTIKSSIARFLGIILLLGICLCVIGLIWLARNNWGANQYFIISLEAILVIISMTGLKILMVPPLGLLTGYWRIAFFSAIAMVLVGGIMIFSYDKLTGWILTLSGLLIILAIFYRLDILIKIIIEESQLYKRERLKTGALFSFAVFLLLAFTHGVTNATTWLMTIFWFCTAIGYLTIKSRMAVAVNFIPGGASKEDRNAFIKHYEKTRTYIDEEMIFNSAERDADIAVHKKNSRAFMSMLLFLISYYLVSIFVGFSTVLLYIYQTVQTKNEST